ncbi:P-loop containing nucleoside triphosphate hydrolase protein [Ganoderma leucocontextum]|nr:P-loop containing nucleoside triphosphate hydrolase protein [Ganoderma leucocontextum]
MASSRQEVPSVAQITAKTLAVLGRCPCLWQCQVAQAQLRGDKDIVCISGTGSGKTLTFWIPLLFRPEGIQVVITPLNLLGSQNTADLEKVGIRGIALSGKTATRQNLEAIELLQYRVIVVNPEVAFRVGGGFQRLWRKSAFTSRLISVIWDEAHCVKAWADFRPEYAQAGRLRNLISTRFLIPSATLHEQALSTVLRTLQVPREKTLMFHRSNDRPNVYLAIHKMQYAVSSFKDLDFLIPGDWKPGTHVPRFVVFFDSIEDSMKAAEHIQQRLPPEHRHKIMWINSDVTTGLRETATQEFARGELIGLFCTDSFGMGVDVPNIELVVQWRTTCDMDTLWQRFGRAARGPGTHALAILIVEAKYFDEQRAAAEERTRKKDERELKKATDREQGKRKRAESASTHTASTRRRLEPPAPALPAAESLVASGEPSVDGELSQFELLRVEFKVASGGSGTASHKKKGKQAEKSEGMGVEMDNLVNAGTRPFRCHRAPITALYANDRFVPDHLLCRSQEDGGCARCCVPPSSVCCCLCSPAHPVFAILPAAPLPQPPRPRASKVPSKYTMSDKDREFQTALNKLRRDRTQILFGLAILNNLGPDLIMGDSILERIAHCARAHKLGSLDDLYRETKWDQTWELGEQVLQLVMVYVYCELRLPQRVCH